METPIMDAHFRDYLAAVAAMQEIYGERGDDHPTEFHDDTVAALVTTEEIEPRAGSHWDA
jgi:hypothetical protein